MAGGSADGRVEAEQLMLTLVLVVAVILFGCESSSIHLVSYSTRNILSYANFSHAVNSAYAHAHNHTYIVNIVDSDKSHEPRDGRWNKVKAIELLLTEEVPSNSYFVWVDSDLIFINFRWKLQDLIDQYDKFDMIFSAEKYAETSVANTGCFIVKNTAWSKYFMSAWWNNYDRHSNHDQIYFDKLYKNMLPDVKSHIVVVPIQMLNSVPPPMYFQQRSHAILHLMGESKLLRETVFSRALAAVRKAQQQTDASDSASELFVIQSSDNMPSWVQHLPRQLGLTRDVLQSLSLSVFRQHIMEDDTALELLANRSLSDTTMNPHDKKHNERTTMMQWLNQLSSARAHVLEYQNFWSHHLQRRHEEVSGNDNDDDGDDEDADADAVHDMSVTIAEVTRGWCDVCGHYQALHSRLRQLMICSHNIEGFEYAAEALQLKCCILNDMIGTRHVLDQLKLTGLQNSQLDLERDNIFDYHEYFEMLDRDLISLRVQVSAPTQPGAVSAAVMQVDEMIARHHHSKAEHLYSAGNTTGAISELLVSVSMFDSLRTAGANMYHSVGARLLLGRVLCAHDDWLRGSQVLKDLIDLLDDLLFAQADLSSSEFVHLAGALVHRGLCLLSGPPETDKQHLCVSLESVSEARLALQRSSVILAQQQLTGSLSHAVLVYQQEYWQLHNLINQKTEHSNCEPTVSARESSSSLTVSATRKKQIFRKHKDKPTNNS